MNDGAPYLFIFLKINIYTKIRRVKIIKKVFSVSYNNSAFITKPQGLRYKISF